MPLEDMANLTALSTEALATLQRTLQLYHSFRQSHARAAANHCRYTQAAGPPTVPHCFSRPVRHVSLPFAIANSA